ncbi:wurmchen 1 transmembrane protein [Cotesia typhae]|uniref:wurmchen 1 transmembrane protein n=1 Tax=Cotesia typhae TaxID=2053667 RepID=UPI003D68A408
MSVLDDRELYKNNTYFTEHIYGDFTPFYAIIAVVSLIGGTIFILNIICCWCSPYKSYWNDRHTGNRWISSFWVVTPHKNPPLDLSELSHRIKHQIIDEKFYYPPSVVGDEEIPYPDSRLDTPLPQEYMELQKRESDI